MRLFLMFALLTVASPTAAQTHQERAIEDTYNVRYIQLRPTYTRVVLHENTETDRQEAARTLCIGWRGEFAGIATVTLKEFLKANRDFDQAKVEFTIPCSEVD